MQHREFLRIFIEQESLQADKSVDSAEYQVKMLILE